ncbi:unnamed protein product [Sphagnum jensenii]|uniref:Rab-GAP TBC domain-containing protein n=1 Tax=Sphagnum jensenii TaxID=128206 RepID=A0ABP1B0M4_9BRYO
MPRGRGEKTAGGVASSPESRDMYGFAVRPQHLKRYREHASIYKEEEAERSERWEQFLGLHSKPVEDDVDDGIVPREGGCEAEVGEEEETASSRAHTWGQLRSSLWAVEQLVRKRRKGKVAPPSVAQIGSSGLTEAAAEVNDAGVGEGPTEGGGDADDSDEEFYDVEKLDAAQDGADQASSEVQDECPWEEELKVLVSGGVPMALRGELWQVFVGAKEQRVHGHYQALLAQQEDAGIEANGTQVLSAVNKNGFALYQQSISISNQIEKWSSQIEKDLPRTFPGHPALGEDGLNILRRLLTAYARHNPAVGYCQAMNFFAALLLLLMPEENAFWTLAGLIDNYFGGYYAEKMVEAQVDQLVFEQLVHECFPRLSTHLDSLGVQVAWVSGPWFLSIFVNVLPWESVLRVWDVLLYEGNRSMLFRTGLALMEIHAGALMLQRDTGDAVAMLQSMGEATFDSSQLVLAACLGFHDVHEDRLEQLRNHHRPSVLLALNERSLELHLWRSTNGVATKTGSLVDQTVGGTPMIPMTSEQAKLGHVSEPGSGSDLDVSSQKFNFRDDEEAGSVDLQEQVVWLKTELSSALEDRKAAMVRAQELEVALTEMVKEDNCHVLSAKVEKLEAQVARLQKALSDKEEQEQVMVQVLVRMEQEQRVADDARRFAEQDAAAQHQITEEAKEMAEKATQELAAMEKRAVMAESMLEATINSEACTGNAYVARRGKVEGAGGVAGDVSDDSSAGMHIQSFFGRPFSLSWGEKSKLNVETKSDPMDNLKAGELLSPVPSFSPRGLEHVNGHSKPTAKQTLSAMIKEARLPQTEVGDDSDT